MLVCYCCDFFTASILSALFIISKNVINDAISEYYDIRCKSECIEVFETAQEQQSCRTGCFLYDPPVIRELLEDEEKFRNIMVD